MVAPKRIETTVILVDNNRRQRNLLSRLFKREMYKIKAFENADAALTELHLNGPPNLIITSKFIPGTDGWRLCRLLRSPEYNVFNHVPILLISRSFPVKAAPRILADLGANAFIPLPVSKKKFIQEVQTLIKGKRERTCLSVMIIEDSGDFTDRLQKAFQDRSFHADTATTAQAALRLLKKNPYNMIVLDYEISNGTGKNLLGIIRKEYQECLCVVVSGDSEIVHTLAGLDLDASVCLPKPVDACRLVDLCERILREQSMLYINDLLEKRSIELSKSKIKYNRGVVREKTKPHDADKKLNEIRAKLRYCLDYAPVGVMIRDLSGRYLEVNSFAEKLLGYESGELLQRSVTDIFAGQSDNEAKGYLSMILINGCCESGSQFRFRRKDGRLIDVILRSFRMTDEYFIAFIYDISERRHMEEELTKSRSRLNRAQKLESLGLLAGGVAHDFNNMLSIILANAEIVLEKIGPDQPVYENMDEIMHAAKRSAEFTRQLLSFIRTPDVMPEIINLNISVNSVIKMLSRLMGKGIKINWNPGRDLWLVRINPSQIDQILVNLCLNARDAIEGEGLIEIETGNICPDDACFSVLPGIKPDNYVFLSVKDNGCGMNRDVLERIFEPFFTTKESGKSTGLGLAVVHGIVKQNQGFIDVDSESGLGTAIKVYLPRHGSNAGQMHSDSLPNLRRRKKNTAGGR